MVIQRGADSGNDIVLAAIDLQAAFDTLDRSLIIRICTKRFGLLGKALKWLKSYLDHRQQSVVMKSVSSKPLPMKTGVDQGSILGPNLFCLFLTTLGDMLREENISYQMYADASMLYFDCKTFQEQDQIKIKVEKIFAWFKWAGLKVIANKPRW